MHNINYLKFCRSHVIAFLTSIVFLCHPLLTIHASEVTHNHRDLTLNANLELAEGKRIQDGVVIVLHGLLAHNKMETIGNIQRALKENGRNSLAINLSLRIDDRHGFFDCNWPHRHLQNNAIYEIASWVNWLREQGVSRVILMAHSRGANQAMIYAVERKDPEVTHLIFLAPGTNDDSKEAYEGRYGPRFDDTTAKAKVMVAANNGEALMEGTDLLFCPSASVSANSFLSYYDVDSPFRKFQTYLPKIDVPTLITTGTIDERSPKIKEKVSPYVDGKLIHLSVIDGAGHFFRDFNMDEAIESAVEFLEESE